jgi:hypothetical protein
MATNLAGTVGEVARRLNAPLHKVNYVVRTRGIRPAATAGAYRLFTVEQVAKIGEALAEIDAREAGRRRAVAQ